VDSCSAIGLVMDFGSQVVLALVCSAMLDVFNADRGVPRSTLGGEAEGPSVRDLSAVSPADIDKVQCRICEDVLKACARTLQAAELSFWRPDCVVAAHIKILTWLNDKSLGRAGR
jgi:hypothetical protein